MKLRALTSLILTFLVGGFLAGCSSQPERAPTYPVTGTVTANGKPVAGASVVFVPVAAGVESAAAITDAAGKFKLTTFTAGDGAQAGDFRVKVCKYDTKPATADEKQRYMSQEDEQKIYAEDERPTPPAKNLLPPKFADPNTSGITHSVKDSPTMLDIKIDENP